MITSWDEYNQIERMCDAAEDKIITGEGEIGQHYMLMHVLKKHGISCFDRLETVPAARRLLASFAELEQA